MLKKKLLSLLLAGAVCLSLGACGNTTSPSSTPTPATPASTVIEAPQSESKPSAEPELTGKVVVYMPSPSGLADKLAAAFTAKTGVEVEQFQGTTGEILARLETEASSPVADVAILASWSDGLSMKKDGKLLSYTPSNSTLINKGWIDQDNMLFGYSASAMGVIYNTTLVPELNADWTELGNTEYKDNIVIPDPEKSGSCKDFLSGLVTGLDNGDQIMQAWADNGLTVPGANKAALEAVTTGEKAILIAGVDYNAYSSIAAGEPLAIYYPTSGTIVNPRPAMIMSTSPNVDNAKAFVDFLFSEEAQQLVAKAYLLPGRSDVQCDNRANLSDISLLPADWTVMMSIASDTAVKLNEITK